MPEIRLNKRNKTIKVVNRKDTLRLQHSGKTGPAGEKGDKGDTGYGLPAGGLTGQALNKLSNDDYDFSWVTPEYNDKTYVQPFTTLATIQVAHNLNKLPAVTIVTSAGDEVVGDVDYIDTNNVQVSFTAPFSGKVICN